MTARNTWLARFMRICLRQLKIGSREQLIQLLSDAKEQQLLNADAFSMIEGVLRVSEMKVRDIMIPRPQMVAVEAEADINLYAPLTTIIQSAHSRFPVVGEDPDQIVGILLAKDLLKQKVCKDLYPSHGDSSQNCAKIKDLIRPAVFIPESKKLDVLLKEFRLNRNHMAIVVDEYGSVAGLVTIEDVLEQIVGDIEDEYDAKQHEPYIKPLNDFEYSVLALTPIEAFNEYFDTHYKNEDFDTVGGLVLHQFGYLPKSGETISFDQLTVQVMQTTARGITLIKVMRQPSSSLDI